MSSVKADVEDCSCRRSQSTRLPALLDSEAERRNLSGVKVRLQIELVLRIRCFCAANYCMSPIELSIKELLSH